MIGAAPQQYARLFDAFGAALRPKVVLLALFPAYALTAVGQFDAWLAAGAPGNYDRWRTGDAGTGWPSALKRGLEETYLWQTLRALTSAWRTGEQDRTLMLATGSELKLMPAVYRSAAARARPGDPAFERVVEVVEEIRAQAQGAARCWWSC